MTNPLCCLLEGRVTFSATGIADAQGAIEGGQPDLWGGAYLAYGSRDAKLHAIANQRKLVIRYNAGVVRVAAPGLLLPLALLACDAIPTTVATQQGTPAPAEARGGESIETSIRSAYALPASATVRQTDRMAGQVRELVRDRINAGLLRKATDMSSRDLFFTPADGLERHLGVFTIRYADPAIARARQGAIARQRFFEESKILIPMTSAVRGNEVLVFYTQSGGDPKLVALLATMAADASKAPAGG